MSWSRVAGWLPFMEMGDAQGVMIYHSQSFKFMTAGPSCPRTFAPTWKRISRSTSRRRPPGRVSAETKPRGAIRRRSSMSDAPQARHATGRCSSGLRRCGSPVCVVMFGGESFQASELRTIGGTWVSGRRFPGRRVSVRGVGPDASCVRVKRFALECHYRNAGDLLRFRGGLGLALAKTSTKDQVVAILVLPLQHPGRDPMQYPGRDFHRFDGGYVQRLRDGDPDTERHFVSYFKDLLRIKLHSRLRSRQLVEDACQETFLRIFKALRSGVEIRDPERFGAYGQYGLRPCTAGIVSVREAAYAGVRFRGRRDRRRNACRRGPSGVDRTTDAGPAGDRRSSRARTAALMRARRQALLPWRTGAANPLWLGGQP
ncbi:MAG: DUF1838 family protein [Aquincola sp.]|nr:DUF1838 family protein [Aquincola sp.]